MLAAVCFMSLAATSDLALFEQDVRSVPAILDLPRGRIIIGQAIDARVVVAAGSQKPTLSIGRGDGVEVVQLAGVEVQPRSSTEIGPIRNVVNTYRFPLRIVARKAGSLAIPSIRVEVEGRTGVVPPRTISAIAPPAAGRTAAFLGGVGAITATAEARPDAVRLGEPFEYRLTLDGPGAIGSSEPASIPAIAKVGRGWKVDHLPSEGTVEPPFRTFRIQVRPDRPGTYSLGPFLVSFLDPASGTYRTTATNGVTVRVVDVPVFDSDRVDVPDPTGRSPLWPGLIVLIGLTTAGLLVLIARFRVARSRMVDPARIARDLIAQLPRTADRSAILTAATASLAEFFGRVGGRPPGVLTPEEARRWAGQLSGRSDLADAAALLVSSCDQTLYAQDAAPSFADDPRRLAEFVLKGMGESSGVEKPREAPGTA